MITTQRQSDQARRRPGAAEAVLFPSGRDGKQASQRSDDEPRKGWEGKLEPISSIGVRCVLPRKGAGKERKAWNGHKKTAGKSRR
jgi:hypothetical protein